jgi:hypothetical protein
MTTLTVGAKFATDCVCKVGMEPCSENDFDIDCVSYACKLCPAGTYKAEASMTNCSGICPNGTTSIKGAMSIDQCSAQEVHDAKAEVVSKTAMSTPAIQGKFNVTMPDASADVEKT